MLCTGRSAQNTRFRNTAILNYGVLDWAAFLGNAKMLMTAFAKKMGRASQNGKHKLN
jgi:hypothetical protein